MNTHIIIILLIHILILAAGAYWLGTMNRNILEHEALRALNHYLNDPKIYSIYKEGIVLKYINKGLVNNDLDYAEQLASEALDYFKSYGEIL